MDGWMDVCMDVWMYGCIDVCFLLSTISYTSSSDGIQNEYHNIIFMIMIQYNIIVKRSSFSQTGLTFAPFYSPRFLSRPPQTTE